jgi:hypothetical protein
MTHPYFELRDIRLDGIRSACAAISETLSRLPATATPSVESELRTRWLELVTLLALEPARVLRACPACKHVGMFEASRCGHCWATLPPPTANDAIAG